MGMEDIDFAANGSVSKVTDFAIGARGIDGMYVTQNGTTTASYPIYDAHGNMITTLSRQGTGSYSTAALRTFDAWGLIRIGTQTGGPNGRYCASLGHKQDDESGLVYMRARFYEPSSGRFANEDPTRHGSNWLSYCYNDPINHSDASGNVPVSSWLLLGAGFGILALAMWGSQLSKDDPFAALNNARILSPDVRFGLAGLALACFAASIFLADGGSINTHNGEAFGQCISLFVAAAGVMIAAAKFGAESVAGIAIFAVTAYGMACLGELAADAFMESQPTEM